MTTSDIITQRLKNQNLTTHDFKKPVQVVEYMGAMQAQEYAMAKWAVGLRIPGLKDADIEQAFNKGELLRTHLLRPTWHFVSPRDIGWLLELTAPRIHQANGFMCRKLGITDTLLKNGATVFEKVLVGKNYLTRAALNEQLLKHKLKCKGEHLTHLLMFAELEGIICSGPRKGKQFTYALLEERAPKQKKLKREEALAELSLRYFTSRGPATLKDYATWSNLTLKDAKEGVASLGKTLSKDVFNGSDYFFLSSSKPSKTVRSFLMPDYDEYGMGYKDRSAIFDAENYKASVSRGNPVFNRMIVLDGRIEGTWQKNIEKGKVRVETFPFAKLTPIQQKALKQAVDEFLAFNTDLD